MAQLAQEQLALDRVLLVVSANQPLKASHGAPAADRLRMVELAVEAIPGLEADGREIARGGPSYTVETLRELQQELPGAGLVLLLGTDAAAELPRWREADTVARLAEVAVFRRGGEPSAGREPAFTVPVVDISSTQVRARAAAGLSLRGWVPDRVADYISGLALYQPQGGAA